MSTMQSINPWSWQDKFDYAQAVEVCGAKRQLFLAGQAAVNAEGLPQHAGDMTAQLELAFDNLEAVLARAGMTLKNIARLSFYTTDVQAFLKASGVVSKRLAALQYKPAGSLLGVSALFHPDIMVELEVTALD